MIISISYIILIFINSIVNNMTVALSSSKAESRVNLLDSLYPFPDAEYDMAESDLDGEDEEDELEEEEEEEEEDGEEDDNSDIDKDDDEDEEDELANGDDDDDDDLGKFDPSLASPPPSTIPGVTGSSIKPPLWPNYPLLLKV